jgi:ribA/ribD-fused uncharacterized protein
MKEIGDEMDKSKWQKVTAHNEFFVKGFFGTYRYLSNFHESPVDYGGIRYNSVEAAYQSAKTTRIPDRQKFVHMSPMEAKKEGQRILLRPDWENIKVRVMTECVFSKFLLDDGLRARLLDTNDKYLEETNYWKDNFWGVDREAGPEGQNNLGKVLMGVRSLFHNINV